MTETEPGRRPVDALTRPQVRRFLQLALLRSVAVTAVLLGLYFVLPLQVLGRVPLLLSLPVELALFLTFSAWQVRAVTRAAYPGVRAVEGLAATVPLFLLMFAVAYVIMSRNDPANFDTSSLTRVDGLYFTITTFASVGFGDITATSQTARVVVMIQMMFDLVVLGLGVRLLIGAVNIGRRRQSDGSPTAGDEHGDGLPLD